MQHDGACVEYALTATDPKGVVQTGTLRISSVGKAEREGQPFRGVEVSKSWREGPTVRHQVRKLLIAEQAFAAGQSLPDHVTASFERTDPGGAVTPLSGRRLREFLNLGLEGRDLTLREVRAREEVRTGLGTLVTRHVAAKGRCGARSLEYHGWLTGEVSTGWARMEVREPDGEGRPRLLFTATVVRHGTGAVSEVDALRGR